MNRVTLLKNYSRDVKHLRREGKQWGLTDDEVDLVIEESFLYLRDKYPELHIMPEDTPPPRQTRRLSSKFYMIVFLLVGVCYGLTYHKPTHNFVERNIQGAIYPFMKFYRRVTLPFIQMFPKLTEFYDEICLIENPLFKVSKMDCWPCENVGFVLNATNVNYKYRTGVPFITKIPDPKVELVDLEKIYYDNLQLWKENEGFLLSNIHFNIHNFIKHNESTILKDYPDLNMVWRVNRMDQVRALRPILRTPTHILNLPVNPVLQRFLLVEGPEGPPFIFPGVESQHVFIKQLKGRRYMVLDPAHQCQLSCRRIHILLEEGYMLWYNWWYWRPQSVRALNYSGISIGWMGSSP